jgi:hypothetical protein
MTPFWQNVFLLILAAIVIPTLGWIVIKIIEYGRDIVSIKTELVAMKTRCGEHREWLITSSKSIERMDKNIVAIAAKLDVPIQT